MPKASTDKRIIAFYGYKGGTGRSLLAANISVALSLIGKRVLLIDWDLEAPGAGDYFNSASGLIPQMWRTHHGVFELLVKCRRMPEGSDLYPVIREFLTAKDNRRPVLPVKFTDFQAKGSLDFVGPGRQVGPEFAAALMTSDWADFFLVHGEAFHKAFRDVVCNEETGYDVVIIDTRTGYNLSTIFVLRLLADVVYFIAPKTIQALLGISNVWKLIPAILGASGDENGSAPPCPELHLILSRYRAGPSTSATDALHSEAATNYVRTVFGEDEPIVTFPVLDGIADYEQLFLQDPNFRSTFFPRKGVFAEEGHNPNVIAYRNAFWGICRDIGGIDLKSFPWEAVIPPEGYVVTRSEVTPSLSQPLLEQGKALVNDYFDRKKDSVALSSLEAWAELEAWADRAVILDRATLGEIILHDKRMRPDWLLEMTSGLKAQLFLDDREDQLETLERASSARADYDQNTMDVAATSPVPAMRKANAGEALPTPTTILEPGVQPDRRRRATRLWMAANTAREQDDPVTAANQLRAAVKLLEETGHGPLSDSTRRDIANDLAIYEWNIAQIMSDLGEWDDAFGRLVHLLELPTLPDSRAADDNKTVSRFDIGWFAIGLCESRLRKTGRPLSPQEMYRIGRLPDLLRNASGIETLIRQANLELDLEKFSFAETVVAPVKDEPEILRKLLRISELQHDLLLVSSGGDPGSRLSVIAETCMTLAMAYRFCGDEQTLHDIELAVADGMALIDSWFSSGGPVPTSAPEQTVALASTLRNSLDRPSDAFAVAQDALQLLGNVSDGRSEKLRIDILMFIGLLENWLGRPDRAERTWAEVAHRAEASDFPAGSDRRRQTDALKWWMAVVPYARGEYEIAWTELTKHEQNYLKVLESPDSSAVDRADARTCLIGITGYLADVVFHLGRFDEAVIQCRKWEADIRKFYYFEVDAGRRLARCNLTLAEVAFCQGENSNALSAIQEGLRHNRNIPEAFGYSFSVVQDKLMLLRNEITAFSFGTIDAAETLAALTRLESTSAKMLAEATSHGWYLIDLISISTTFARAAATALRQDDRVRAEFIANEVLTRWLAFLPRFERADTKWVTDLARTPRTMANAILAKARGETGPTDNARVATEGIRQMLPVLRRRYAHIFALCGFDIAA